MAYGKEFGHDTQQPAAKQSWPESRSAVHDRLRDGTCALIPSAHAQATAARSPPGGPLTQPVRILGGLTVIVRP